MTDLNFRTAQPELQIPEVESKREDVSIENESINIPSVSNDELETNILDNEYETNILDNNQETLITSQLEQ